MGYVRCDDMCTSKYLYISPLFVHYLKISKVIVYTNAVIDSIPTCLFSLISVLLKYEI